MLQTGKEVDTLSLAPFVDTGLKSILIASDLSPASDKPLRHALALARHYGARFYLTHVVPSLGYTIAGPQAPQLAAEAAAREVALLEHHLTENGSLAGLEHEFIVREGDIWKELDSVMHQKQVDLLVVGTHGRRNLQKLFLGSVAEQIFRHAGCMVLTVGPHSFEDSPLEKTRPIRSILFATDFGPASCRALQYAISFANHFAVKLVMLHVSAIAQIPDSFHWSRTSGDVRQLQEDARQSALRRLKQMGSGSAPLNMEPEFLVKFGTPCKVIVNVADALRADLIVMGLNRTGPIDAASHMPWATAYEVVCSAGCPVLTVRS